jgi:hypothetical protein
MVILAHLLFLIRVAKDNDIAVIGWPEKPMVGVTEELSGDLLISWSVRGGTLLPWREIHHWESLRRLIMLVHWGRWPWDEISGEESGGGEDPIKEGDNVEASLDEDEDLLT